MRIYHDIAPKSNSSTDHSISYSYKRTIDYVKPKTLTSSTTTNSCTLTTVTR